MLTAAERQDLVTLLTAHAGALNCWHVTISKERARELIAALARGEPARSRVRHCFVTGQPLPELDRVDEALRRFTTSTGPVEDGFCVPHGIEGCGHCSAPGVDATLEPEKPGHPDHCGCPVCCTDRAVGPLAPYEACEEDRVTPIRIAEGRLPEPCQHRAALQRLAAANELYEPDDMGGAIDKAVAVLREDCVPAPCGCRAALQQLVDRDAATSAADMGPYYEAAEQALAAPCAGAWELTESRIYGAPYLDILHSMVAVSVDTREDPCQQCGETDCDHSRGQDVIELAPGPLMVRTYRRKAGQETK